MGYENYMVVKENGFLKKVAAFLLMFLVQVMSKGVITINNKRIACTSSNEDVIRVKREPGSSVYFYTVGKGETMLSV